jgi:hypothetical protein
MEDEWESENFGDQDIEESRHPFEQFFYGADRRQIDERR